ncbi:MAG: hypothetical protein J5I93_17060, partial [Pirellulaceae bacterium]|nr:hypothetical protein [Pirellulaceae bacterium]
MVTRLLTGNAAAAWAARLARVDYVPAFPITPQTEIIETLADWFAGGQLAGKFVTMDSEHSMLMAAGAAAATGVRTFTATSSQGLLHAMEAMYTVSGWRVPLVLVNVSRGLSAPITLGPDHNDVLAARDSGFLQLHAETCQEVLDSVLIAFRLAEDPRISLPVLVNLDGFYLSFTREPVELPEQSEVDRFLPPPASPQPGFRASRPVAQGVAVLEGAVYSYFRYQLHLAMTNALEVYEEVAEEFARQFGRRYEPLDQFHSSGRRGRPMNTATIAPPADFDAFWDEIDAELAQLPAAVEREHLPLHSTDHSDAWRLRLTSAGPYRIEAFLSVPHGDGP